MDTKDKYRRSARLRKNNSRPNYRETSSSDNSDDNNDPMINHVPSDRDMPDDPPKAQSKPSSNREAAPKSIRKTKNRQHSPMFESIQKKHSVDVILEGFKWCREYSKVDKDEYIHEVVELVNFILEGAGFPLNFLEVNDIKDKDISDVMDEICGTIDRQNIDMQSPYPLIAQKKPYQDFSRYYILFWKELVLSMDTNIDDVVRELLTWVRGLASSKVRCKRYAGSITAFAICDGLLSLYNSWTEQLLLKKKQRDAQSCSEHDPVYAELNRQIVQLENKSTTCVELLNTFQHLIFTYRSFDVAPEIRILALEALIRWAKVIPDRFLSSNSYVKHFGFTLCDKELSIQSSSMEFICEAVTTPKYMTPLLQSNFFSVFSEQIVNLASNPDLTIRVNALKTLTVIEEEKHLFDDHVEEVLHTIWNIKESDKAVIEPLAAFIDKAYFKFSILHDVSQGKFYDHDTVLRDTKALLQFVTDFGSDKPLFADRIVTIFWNRAPVLYKISMFIDILIQFLNTDVDQREEFAEQAIGLCRVIISIFKKMKEEYTEECIDIANVNDKFNLLTAAEKMFQLVPTIIIVFKSSSKVLEIALQCVYELSDLIDKARSVEQSKMLLESLKEPFFELSSSLVLESIHGIMGRVSISLKSLPAIDVYCDDVRTQALKQLSVSYNRWVYVMDTDRVEVEDRSTADLIVCLRRVAAIGKMANSNPFNNEDGDRCLHILIDIMHRYYVSESQSDVSWTTIFDLRTMVCKTNSEDASMSQSDMGDQSFDVPKVFNLLLSRGVWLLTTEILLTAIYHLIKDVNDMCEARSRQDVTSDVNYDNAYVSDTVVPMSQSTTRGADGNTHKRKSGSSELDDEPSDKKRRRTHTPTPQAVPMYHDEIHKSLSILYMLYNELGQGVSQLFRISDDSSPHVFDGAILKLWSFLVIIELISSERLIHQFPDLKELSQTAIGTQENGSLEGDVPQYVLKGFDIDDPTTFFKALLDCANNVPIGTVPMTDAYLFQHRDVPNSYPCARVFPLIDNAKDDVLLFSTSQNSSPSICPLSPLHTIWSAILLTDRLTTLTKRLDQPCRLLTVPIVMQSNNQDCRRDLTDSAKRLQECVASHHNKYFKCRQVLKIIENTENIKEISSLISAVERNIDISHPAFLEFVQRVLEFSLSDNCQRIQIIPAMTSLFKKFKPMEPSVMNRIKDKVTGEANISSKELELIDNFINASISHPTSNQKSSRR